MPDTNIRHVAIDFLNQRIDRELPPLLGEPMTNYIKATYDHVARPDLDDGALLDPGSQPVLRRHTATS